MEGEFKTPAPLGADMMAYYHPHREYNLDELFTGDYTTVEIHDSLSWSPEGMRTFENATEVPQNSDATAAIQDDSVVVVLPVLPPAFVEPPQKRNGCLRTNSKTKRVTSVRFKDVKDIQESQEERHINDTVVPDLYSTVQGVEDDLQNMTIHPHSVEEIQNSENRGETTAAKGEPASTVSFDENEFMTTIVHEDTRMQQKYQRSRKSRTTFGMKQCDVFRPTKDDLEFLATVDGDELFDPSCEMAAQVLKLRIPSSVIHAPDVKDNPKMAKRQAYNRERARQALVMHNQLVFRVAFLEKEVGRLNDKLKEQRTEFLERENKLLWKSIKE